MDDEVAIIHEEPTTGGFALSSPGDQAGLALCVIGNAIGEGPQLAIVVAITYEEIIGE